MVNLVAALRPSLHGLMKMAGVTPYTVEIEPGTVMNFWVPLETLKKPKKGETPEPPAKPNKPVVVLVHAFSAEGIVMWQFQVGALTKKYSVYVPDLLFFGGSITDKTDRSPSFQAECLATGLRKLRVERCTVVGFSYGGMVGFKMAELYPDLVKAMVVSCSTIAMTESIRETILQNLGFSSFSELLLPTSVKGLKTLLSVTAHKKLWFPDRLFKDFLEQYYRKSSKPEQHQHIKAKSHTNHHHHRSEEEEEAAKEAEEEKEREERETVAITMIDLKKKQQKKQKKKKKEKKEKREMAEVI
uniref:AB hydrolase-1 domain-containing protein n=1 Tax=Fagus sylvatica TaxID=28930 RepID=A0A2N9EC33_FAGSY